MEVHHTKRLLKIGEACEYLNVCERQIYKLMNRGELSKIKIGGSLRFDIRDLDEFVNANKEDGNVRGAETEPA